MSAPKTTVVLPVRFFHDSRAVQTTTREISEDGVFVRCLEPPPAGAQVALRIYLPGLAVAAEFVGQVREVSSNPGDSGFWADFVSAQLDAHESLLRVLSGGAVPPSSPSPSTGPVPLASLYKRVHVNPPPSGTPGAPTSAHSNPLHAMPADPPPPPKRRSGVGDLIQGTLNQAASEKAAEVLAWRRNTPPGPSVPGRQQSSPGRPVPPSAPKHEAPRVQHEPPPLPVEPPPAPQGRTQGPPPLPPPVVPSLPNDVALDSDASNRRAFPRYRARFAVRFSSVQDFVLEYAANISAGGVFVLTDHPPEMDAVITVVLELPDGGAPVACKALVVHRVTPQQARERNTQSGVGVQFIEANDEFRERIDQTISQILGQAEV